MEYCIWSRQWGVAYLGMELTLEFTSPFSRETNMNADTQQEWEYQLRSSLHPALFGAAYHAAYRLMSLLDVVPFIKSSVLVALPKIIQSVFAAGSDFYTWKLAEKVFGANSNPAWATVYTIFFS